MEAGRDGKASVISQKAPFPPFIRLTFCPAALLSYVSLAAGTGQAKRNGMSQRHLRLSGAARKSQSSQEEEGERLS